MLDRMRINKEVNLKQEGFINVTTGVTPYGYIEICIKEQGSPYIHVFHENTEAALYESLVFGEAVIELLTANGKLQLGQRHRLERAALSMQSPGETVYKALYCVRSPKISISKEFCIANGAVEVLDVVEEPEPGTFETRQLGTEFNVLLKLNAHEGIENFYISNGESGSLVKYVVADGCLNNVELHDICGALHLSCDCNDFLAFQFCDHTIAVAKRVLDPINMLVKDRGYEVSVKRTSYAFCTIPVTAKSRREAEAKALDAAGDYEYRGRDATYGCEGVREVIPDDATRETEKS